MTDEMANRLRRQSLWLKEYWLWLLITKVLPQAGHTTGPFPGFGDALSTDDGPLSAGPGAPGNGGPEGADGRPTALDVGCGPGYVMDIFSPVLSVKGIDRDPDMVAMAKSRGRDVRLANAEKLPFKDGSFDIVYCTYFLMWVKDPVKVLSEMKRVSRRWVLCLAEPDYGGRLDYPDALGEIGPVLSRELEREGADPHCGRRLRSHFRDAGMEAEIGIHAGVWDNARQKSEFEGEWALVEQAGKQQDVPAGKLARWKKEWKRALAGGALFQFNPVFYAIGMMR